MKKVNLLIMLILSGFVTYACGNYGANSSLNLKLWNNSSFRVVLDGQQYNKTSFLRLGQLTPGNHSLLIVKTIKPNHGNGGFKKVLYNGKIHIPVQSKVIATLQPNLSLAVKVLNNNNQINHCGQNNSCQTNNSNYYEYSMDDNSFNMLLNSISNNSFDSGKMAIVKQALVYNKLTTNQVIILMNQLSFESNRLKLAKLAYTKTTDKHNYFLVNNAFNFNSSVNNLNNYINHQI